MKTITVEQKTTIPDPRWGAYVKGVALTAAQELDFRPGTWPVNDTIYAIWNGTYELPADATDRHGLPFRPPPGNERLAVELPPPINPEPSLEKPE